MRSLLLIVLIGIAIMFSGCAHQNAESDGILSLTNPKVEPKARPLFNQAEKNYAAKRYEQARSLYQTIKAKFPKSKAHRISSYRLGTLHYYQQDYEAASREFETFDSLFPHSELELDIVYNWAASEYQLGHYNKAQQLLSRFSRPRIQSESPRRAEVIWKLKGQVSEALSQYDKAIEAYSNYAQLPVGDSRREATLSDIDTLLSRIATKGDLQRLLEVVDEPTTRAKILARLRDQESVAVTHLPESAIPSPSTIDIPVKRLSPRVAKNNSGRIGIGVVLPLTGKLSSFGKRALNSVLLAAGTFNEGQDSGIDIHVADTASSPLIAAGATESLINDQNVAAILGPFSVKEASAVAEVAEQNGVINFSLSPREGLSEKPGLIYQNALTPRIQMERLAQFAVQQKGFKRFAILAPNDNLGKDLTEQFWNGVEKMGAKVVAFHSYSPTDNDFQILIKELVGLADFKYRKLEWTKLNEFVEEQQKKTGRNPKARLSPIIDFDALFIADGPKNAAQLAASLAYFDVNGIPLLGTSEWNTDLLFQRGGRYVEGALFPGGFNLQSKDPQQRKFIRAHVDNLGSNPDLLAAQSFEAALLLMLAARETGGDSNEMGRWLSGLTNFSSPIGKVSFEGGRIARREMPIYQINAQGQTVEQ